MLKRATPILLAAALAWALGSLTGCFLSSGPRAHHAAPHIASVAPVLPGGVAAPQRAPPCPAQPSAAGQIPNHAMGSCAPKPVGAAPSQSLLLAHRIKLGRKFCDVSNNDPIYGVGRWRALYRQGIRECYLKVNEGTGFIDSTAKRMEADAAKAHIATGGYDFQHVCGNSPTGEASLFTRLLRADHLLGKGHPTPMADVESGRCSNATTARRWELTWHTTVAKQTRTVPGEYTGQWYSNPTFGCWWVSKRTLAWISGYGVRYPYMPCGRSKLNDWQYTSTSPTGDLSYEVG